MEYVKAHNKISREVKESDMERVAEMAEKMIELCKKPIGRYLITAHAIAHCQVDDSNSLRFYVRSNSLVYINPEIIKHSNYEVDKNEGCMWFLDKGEAVVKRWQKCVVKAKLMNFNTNEIINDYEENLTGLDAQIAQHELDHLNGKTIFEINK